MNFVGSMKLPRGSSSGVLLTKLSLGPLSVFLLDSELVSRLATDGWLTLPELILLGGFDIFTPVDPVNLAGVDWYGDEEEPIFMSVSLLARES